jgi:hypothetical protein
MIDYLNANQGFVIGLLTAVYVIATVILVAVAQRQAALTQKSLDFASKSEKSKYRPYVIFDITYEKIVAYARLKNSGASPALDVRVSVSPRLGWKDRETGIGFIEKGVSFLAPNRELAQPFGWTTEFFAQYPDLKFSGDVKYRDSEGHEYSESFSIDLGYIKGMSYIGEVDPGKELEGIKKALDRFHSGMFKPLVRTIDESKFQAQEAEHREAALHRLKELKKEKEKLNQSTEPTSDSAPR